MLIAGFGWQIRIEGKFITHRQFDWPFCKTGDADFWPLQIAEHRHRTTVFAGEFTHRVGSIAMFFGGAVGEVETHNIDAGNDQSFEYPRFICGWSQSTDYFCTSKHKCAPEFVGS